jgi:hypothetical protein
MNRTYKFQGGTAKVDVNDDWTGNAVLEWKYDGERGGFVRTTVPGAVLKAIFKAEGAKLMQEGLDNLLRSLDETPS